MATLTKVIDNKENVWVYETINTYNGYIVREYKNDKFHHAWNRNSLEDCDKLVKHWCDKHKIN